jgi:ketosteroid isomerase-like protein
MSRENVEFVRRGVEAFGRGEWDSMPDLFAEDVEWYDPPSLPGASLHRGHAAMRARWDELEEALSGFTVLPEAYFDAGDSVVVFLRTKGRGRASGIEMERCIAQLFTVRDGVVASVVGYDDRDRALVDAGLDPDSAEPVERSAARR